MSGLTDYVRDLAEDPLSWVLLAVIVAGFIRWAPALMDRLRPRGWPKRR